MKGTTVRVFEVFEKRPFGAEPEYTALECDPCWGPIGLPPRGFGVRSLGLHTGWTADEAIAAARAPYDAIRALVRARLEELDSLPAERIPKETPHVRS